jgi:2'-hydroxyisoflavone reductase
MLQDQSIGRRQFLGASLATAAMLAAPRDAWAQAPAAAKKKTLLVLGGTNFTGPHIVAAALARGYTVTLFNRGKTNADLFPDLEKLVGDRDPDVGEGIKALRGRKFDAVIDTSGHVPRHVRAGAELMAPNIGQYVFVSSLSAYAAHDTPGADESAAVAPLLAPTEDFNGDAFGPLKALCENAVQDVLPDRGTIVRPGLIVGPRDRSDRFTYWVARVDRGGEVLAPGAPDDPIMIIDGRDLADWLITLIEQRTFGVFNAIGPEHMTMEDVLDACREASASDATFTWVDAAFLEANGAHAWTDLPVWMPPTGEMAGFHRRSIKRALAAGIKFRPILDTCRDTLQWYQSLPEAQRKRLKRGLTPERERKLLAQWHEPRK